MPLGAVELVLALAAAWAVPVVRKILERSAGRYSLRRISDGGVVDLSAHGAYVLSGRRLEDYFARRYDGWRIREIDYALRLEAFDGLRSVRAEPDRNAIGSDPFGGVESGGVAGIML